MKTIKSHLALLTVRLACSSVLAMALLALPSTASALPPGWGYELISPADTGGADITSAIGSADDEHAWVFATVPLFAGQATGNIDVFAASRTSSGWQLQDLAEPLPVDGKSYSYVLLARTPDASHSLVSACPRAALGCDGDTRYVRVGSDGSRVTVMTVPAKEFAPQQPVMAGASRDLSRIVIQEAPPPNGSYILPQDTHTAGSGLYLGGNGGLVEFLGVDENGAVLKCGAVLGNGDNAGFEQTGLSADGRVAAFTSPDPQAVITGACPPSLPQVYVRHDGQTFNISRPRNGHTDEGAKWVGSSQDGSTVFFTTTSQMMNTDTDTVNDIYAYDVATDTVTPITTAADVQTVQVSPDGNYIYYTAGTTLGGQGTPGANNLYLYHNGITTFITSAPINTILLGGGIGATIPSLTTPDGRYLLFYSRAPLAGPPTNGNYQLLQYSTVDGQLRCISCHPDGTVPTGFTLLPGNVANPLRSADQRLQSDDGQTVVFETKEPLLPQDTNSTLDIYLWRHGDLYLISNPRIPSDLGSLAGMSASGNSVYFRSADRLTPDATQDNLKMYVARLGGGFAFPPAKPSCTGDECQPPPTSPPTIAPPASATFNGSGNLTTTPFSSKPTAKLLTAAQRRARALKACQKLRSKAVRKTCESRARKHFPARAGATPATKSKASK